ncbi:MAG: radical SAM protein [bacterium]
MKMLCLRLSDIRDTATSSTHRVLADLALTAMPAAEIDFAFLPPKRAPRVSGYFSGRDWASFDLILVTNSFIQEAINLPWLLHANGISPWAVDRPETFPPVILGGSNAFAAQCLVRPDGQAVPDLFFFGEAEEALPLFIRRWHTATGNKRERLLQAVAQLEGFWVTGAVPAVPIRQAVAHIPPPPHTLARPLVDVATAGTVRVQVGAGCAAFCSFCFEGYERKPYREHAAAEVLSQARSLKIRYGARVAELDGFNLNAYAGLGELVEKSVRLFDQVAFKSQRADGIAACPGIIDLERAAGKHSFTLGIEGISARMRAFLSKSLSDEDLAAALKALLDRRVRELKLFFILTAYETAEDLAAFGDFCMRLKGWTGLPNAGTRVVLSFGRLVRMPNTPLAYDRLFLDEDDWRFAVDGVAAACRRAQLECRFATHWPDYLGTQLLAACGHDAAEAVVALACEGLSYHSPWRVQEATRLHAAVPLRDTAHSSTPSFPFVARAVSEVFLRKRWELAQRFLDGGYCLAADCLGCGACADAVARESVTARDRTARVTQETVEAVARIEADKRRLMPVCVRVTLPDGFCGHSPEWVSARLLQDILARHPQLADTLLAVEEALFSVGANEERQMIPSGETVLTLKAWDAKVLAETVVSDIGDGLRLDASLLNVEPRAQPVPLPRTFAPGVFVRATWQLSTAATPREAANQASAWLKDLHLPHTLRRNQEAWHAELAPAAAKKNCVFELCVNPEAEGACVTVTFAPKAPVHDLLARLTPLKNQPRARCAEIRFS